VEVIDYFGRPVELRRKRRHAALVAMEASEYAALSAGYRCPSAGHSSQLPSVGWRMFNFPRLGFFESFNLKVMLIVAIAGIAQFVSSRAHRPERLRGSAGTDHLADWPSLALILSVDQIPYDFRSNHSHRSP